MKQNYGGGKKKKRAEKGIKMRLILLDRWEKKGKKEKRK